MDVLLKEYKRKTSKLTEKGRGLGGHITKEQEDEVMEVIREGNGNRLRHLLTHRRRPNLSKRCTELPKKR